MHGPFLGEFMGTLVLILLGDGVVANVLLKKSKGEGSGWIVIATAWGLAVVAGIFTAVAFGSPAAHLNPAITLTVALLTGSWSNVALFWTAQILGAFTGAVLVWMTYLPHWKVTRDAGAKLAVFCTAPAIRNLPANLLTEIIATTCLIVVGFSFGSKDVSTSGLGVGLGPGLWGILVWAIGLSLGGPTGYAMNPARDFGPRVAHAILPTSDKGNSDWGYAWVPIAGPFIAAGISAAIIRLADIR
jgi:glycerol uptake facilitator protein